MCTVNVDERAAPLVADLLIRMRDILAADAGIDPEDVMIGPVDLGAAEAT